MSDVEDIYDGCVLSVINHEQLAGSVTYPLYQTSEIGNLSMWSTIHTMHFRDGASFITNPDLTEYLPATLQLFSSFVKYKRNNKHTSWIEDPSMYDALPSLIINIAQHSRIDSGYRLLERCVRHGHDPKMQSLFYNSTDIVKLADGSLGLVIKTKVSASMKAQVYKTAIAISAMDMLATECSCRSGSKDDDRVVCVHNLPVAYKVMELLLDGLAEHFLLKLASCITMLSERWTSGKKQLMEAAGAMLSCEDKVNKTLEELLNQFITGTEKAKVWGQHKKISNPSKQGPIEMLCYESPAKKARRLKDCNQTVRNKTIIAHECDVNKENTNTFTPDNPLVSLLTNATGRIGGGNQLGFRLNEIRTNIQKNGVELNVIMQMKENAEKGWEKLNKMAQYCTIQHQNIQNLKPRKKRSAIDESCMAVHHHKKHRVSKASKPKKKQGKKTRLTKIPHTYCAKVGCKVNNINSPSTRFHRIPAFPRELPDGAP